MDILTTLKNVADHLVWDILDRRLLLSIVRLAALLGNAAVLVLLGQRLFSRVRLIQQWFLAMCGCAVAIATPMEGMSLLRRDLMVWVMLTAVLLLVFCPAIVAEGLAPARPARARIERILYCFIFGTLLAQEIATWCS